MNGHAIIVVNPQAHQGKGWKRWLSIKEAVVQSLPVPVCELVTERGSLLSDRLLPMLQDTLPACIISAGGDGSLHTLVNCLLKGDKAVAASIPIGAIGLGSSNDFLKPFQHKIHGIPVRIGLSGPMLQHDAGRAVYRDAAGQVKETYFLVNASFGATAEGNWRFNHPGPLLKWLKKYWTAAAISYTAFSTILRFKNAAALIRYNGEEREVQVSNINLIKNPFISGSLHYPQPMQADDGQLGLHICTGMNRRELIQTLTGLEKGRFPPGAKRRSACTRDFRLQSAVPRVFECDGETDRATDATITIVPKAITLLGP